MIKRVISIVEKFIVPSRTSTEDGSKVIDKVLELLLYILDGLKSFDMSIISDLQWAPIFALKNNRYFL